MAKQIHYEDNIYFLHSMVKTLRKGLMLQLDNSFFLDKTVEDILFIDTIIDRNYDLLNGNRNLINRAECLKAVMRVKSAFAELLTGLINEELAPHFNLGRFSPRFREIADKHAAGIKEISAYLAAPDNMMEPEDQISQTELNLLLNGEQDF